MHEIQFASHISLMSYLINESDLILALYDLSVPISVTGTVEFWLRTVILLTLVSSLEFPVEAVDVMVSQKSEDFRNLQITTTVG